MTQPTASRNVVVRNPQGLHLRPAHLLAQAAKQFDARIELVKGSERADGKSVLAILTLAAAEGTELLLEAQGPDAEAALDALAELFCQNFTEELESSEEG